MKLGTTFEQYICPKCKNPVVSLIRIEICDNGSCLRKIVLDICPKCGTKLSKHVEFKRKLTNAKLSKLYPKGRTKPQVREI